MNIPHTFSNLDGKFKRIETEIFLNDDLKLSLTTYHQKSGRKGLNTYVSVSKKIDGTERNGSFMYSHRIGQDFHKSLCFTTERVTVNRVLNQHGEYLKRLDEFVASANQYYGLCETV